MVVRWMRRLAAGLLVVIATVAHCDEITDAKKLLKSNDPEDRARAIEMLVEADSKRSIEPLEDAIRRSRSDMDALASTVDELDITWMNAVNQYEWALRNGEPDLARQLLDIAREAGGAWFAVSQRATAHLAVLTMAGQSMARFRSKGAVRQIERGAKLERDALIQQMYIAALGASKRPEGVPTLIDLLRDRDPRARSVAARALRPFVLQKPVIDALMAMKDDKDWAPRLQAYETLARAPFDVTVPFLIEVVQKEEGQIAANVDALLLSLTGQSFADDPRAWSVWWNDHGEEVLAGTFEPNPPQGRGVSNTLASFFTIPIVSKNVLFVVDMSASMNEPMSLPGDWANELRLQHKLPATRLGYAQTELIRAVKGLPKDAQFNIVLYDDRAQRFSKKAVKASKSNRTKALKWALAQDTGWMTNFWDALRVAFLDHVNGKNGVNRFRDLADTIVFLSDGSPTRGRFQDGESLIRLVEHWNLATGAVIHTIGVGEEHERELLLALAANTNGCYLDILQGERGLARHDRFIPGDERGPHIGRKLHAAVETLETGDWQAKVEAIGEIESLGAWAGPVLGKVAAALDDGDSGVQEAATKALIAFGPPAIEPTLPYLKSDDPGVVLRALGVFRELGRKGTASIVFIIPLLDHAADEVKHAAIETLGKMGPAAAEARPKLESMCQSGNEETRRLAERALQQIGE